MKAIRVMRIQPSLKFLARGTAMVPDIDAQDRNIRRFIARRFDALIGEPFSDPQTGESKMSGGFVPTQEPETVKFHHEYVRECKAGGLWPADKETADVCGVPFDPSFGAAAPEPDKRSSRSK